MPRGKRKPTLEIIGGQIEAIDAQLEKYKEKVCRLQEQKKALLDKKKKCEMELLYQRIEKSGKSVHDFLDMANP